MHSKVYHKQNQKTTHRVEENIGNQCGQQGINVQNLQRAHKTQYQKFNNNNKNPVKKYNMFKESIYSFKLITKKHFDIKQHII